MSRRASSPPPVSTFPRPAPTFVGRRAEIDRVLTHLPEEVLFLFHGLGGIGKTELVLEVVREARERPPLRHAVPIQLAVRPGATATRVLAELLDATGADRVPRRAKQGERALVAEQLGALARVLDARAHVVFIDDAHHLPPHAVAEALGFLSRHVRASRILVASRHKLELPADAPAPLVTTLGPLDPDASARLLRELAGRLALHVPDPEGVLRDARGSPFHIRRALSRPGGRHEEDALDASVGELSPSARRLLRAAAVAHRPSVTAARSALAATQHLDGPIEELERRFLLDVVGGRLVVHDLVREPLLERATPEERARAHSDAAELRLVEARLGGQPARVAAIDAIVHRLEADQLEAAWALVEEWRSPLAIAGHDHLLVAPLERLRAAMPARRVAIELLLARTLVRASALDEADAVLGAIGPRAGDAEEARLAALAGEIAQRRGRLLDAEVEFERAAALAVDDGGRFAARVQLASVAALRGQTDEARRIVDELSAASAAPTPHQRARCAWVRTTSWMFEERYERAAVAARTARLELASAGPDDLAGRLAMLETLAAIEAEDVAHVREAAAQIDEAGLRRRVATLYRAVVEHAGGGSRRAAATLVETFEALSAQGDAVNACLAGHYGAAALAATGALGDARALAERAGAAARTARLEAVAAQSLAQQALLAAESMDRVTAHRLADEALSSPHVGARSRATAHAAHARAYTIEGDIPRALESIARAQLAVADPELSSARAVIDAEQAAIELVGGNLEHAVELAERCVTHYRERVREHETARARLVLAASYLARARQADLVLAERTIAQARELADRGELRAIQVGCSILSAALARRAGREALAEQLLADALRELDPERASVYAATLLAAIDAGFAAWALPGVAALLAHIGFSGAVDLYLVDRRGRRAATRAEAERERGARELFVDELDEAIVARRGAASILGRPMQCALLSTLIQARGEHVSPEDLYRRVWGGATYHPLHHRNALYVALNRLRAGLEEILPGRDVVVRTAAGWRIADDVDACVAVAARQPSRGGQTT